MFSIAHANIKDWAKNYDGPLFDGILCDPPYELGFMGKSWDSSGIAFDSDMWADLFKLVKPGGHLLAFSGSRTYHRMAVAIEDAGFEIRDMIEWIYGSGFPKSLDISKAIDKNNGKNQVDLTPFGSYIKERRESKGYSRKQLDELMGTNTAVSWWEGRASGVQLPSKATYEKLKPILELDNRFDELIDWAEAEREIVGTKTSGIANKDEGARYTIGASKSVEVDITIPKTANAQHWNGYGTALKPAHEPCVLARKPIEGTVSQNVLKHGTGGLNIDGTRVASELPENRQRHGGGSSDIFPERGNNATMPSGRFPANLIHDGSDEVEAVFPQTAKSRPDHRNEPSSTGDSGIYGKGYKRQPNMLNDSGSASRFFYCAKSSKSERNAGLEGFEERVQRTMNDYSEDGENRNSNKPKANYHPTVKPLSLTKYLATLIKPPTGGRLLVPFSGSGSEMIGALQAGWEYVQGVELTEEYIPIAEARIKHWVKQPVQETLDV